MLKYAIKTEIGKFHQKFGLLTTKQHIFTIYFPVPGAWSGGYRGGDPGDGPWRREHRDDQGDPYGDDGVSDGDGKNYCWVRLGWPRMVIGNRCQFCQQGDPDAT